MIFEGHFDDLLTLCARLTRDLLAIAKFVVVFLLNKYDFLALVCCMILVLLDLFLLLLICTLNYKFICGQEHIAPKY